MITSSCREKKEPPAVQAPRCLPNSTATHSRAEAIGGQASIVYAFDATGVGEGPLTQKKVSAERLSEHRQKTRGEQPPLILKVLGGSKQFQHYRRIAF